MATTTATITLSSTDLLGRPSKIIKNKVLLYLYNDGSVIRKIITK